MDVNSRTVRLQLKSLTCYFVDNSCNQLAGQCPFHSSSLQPTRIRSTNFFIVNTAISEFMFPLQMNPFFVAQFAVNSMNWPVIGTLGSILCKTRGLPASSFGHCFGAGSLLRIAFDRCIAVMWPMKAHVITPTRRATALAVGCSFDSKLYGSVRVWFGNKWK